MNTEKKRPLPITYSPFPHPRVASCSCLQNEAPGSACCEPSTPPGILAFSESSVSSHLLPLTFLKLYLIVLRSKVKLGLDISPQL